ncbi:hypothetical protein B4N89_20795 [Embleya scabrispora]|uniref:Exonuclease domain-containing protein n=1 Tax=Embleya scabrispora TaxID=159449 RepID=A0A1T3P7V6_9ACTN|nr:hypothetical protein B4N89_20795 [Embleya scabrispora]
MGGVASAPWHTGCLASYDCETTGVDVDTARIVTAALVVPGREPVLWLADPGIDIPDEAAAVHGVSTEHAREHGQPAALVIDDICERLADEVATRSVLIIMNAPYDLTVLDRECRRHDLPTLVDRLEGQEPHVVDPLVLDRAADKWRKGSRKLDALAAHYGVKFDRAHAADADAQAALDVAVRIAEKFTELQVPAAQLHAWQVVWHARWAASFEEYLRRKDPTAAIDRSWPVVPYAGGVS